MFRPQRTNLSDVPGKEYQGNIFLSAVGPDGNDTAVITGLLHITLRDEANY